LPTRRRGFQRGSRRPACPARLIVIQISRCIIRRDRRADDFRVFHAIPRLSIRLFHAHHKPVVPLSLLIID
jgi:hypothetical protein